MAMTKQTPLVGVLSPGDMGRSIGMVLQAHGIRTLTCLAGRSERTRALAADAGFADTASLAELVQRVDILLCVLVPDRAAGVADEVAAAVRATGADLLYADCNAVSPQTVRAIAQTLEDAGARFVDVGIVGPPPVVTGSTGSATRFHASGSGSAELAALGSYGLDVRVVGPEVGQASGLKMCYGALTKGLQAWYSCGGAEMLAWRTLRVEQEESVPEPSGGCGGWSSMPPKAYRWVGRWRRSRGPSTSSG
jgi:3-hydroxyisobutyrate dehydrogenase-like beta-hydroxyacid dehydrogenase